MRFACDKCKTKYSIDDARVRGKVLKIRCKTCSNVITVRDPTPAVVARVMPMAASQPTTPAPAAPADVEWYVSFDGEQEGPLSLEKAAERTREELAGGKQAHAWRDGFVDWLPAPSVPELAKLLAATAAPTPSVALPGPAAHVAAPTSAPAVAAPTADSAPVLTATSAGPIDDDEEIRRPSASAPQLVIGTPATISSVAAAAVVPQLQPSAGGNGKAAKTDASGTIPLDLSAAAAAASIPLQPPVADDEGNAQHHVVYVAAGTAPGSARWLKWFAVAATLVIVGLVAALGYLLRGQQLSSPDHPPTASSSKGGRVVDDKPVAFVDRAATSPPAMGQPEGKHGNGQGHSQLPAGKAPGKLTAAVAPSSPSSFPQFNREDLERESRLPTVDERERYHPQVSESAILGVMQTNKQSLSQCYDRALKHDQTLQKARVDVSVHVGVSGAVTKVSLEGNGNAELNGCLAQAVKRWRFPSTGAEYQTAFPLLLQAGF